MLHGWFWVSMVATRPEMVILMGRKRWFSFFFWKAFLRWSIRWMDWGQPKMDWMTGGILHGFLLFKLEPEMRFSVVEKPWWLLLQEMHGFRSNQTYNRIPAGFTSIELCSPAIRVSTQQWKIVGNCWAPTWSHTKKKIHEASRGPWDGLSIFPKTSYKLPSSTWGCTQGKKQVDKNNTIPPEEIVPQDGCYF